MATQLLKESIAAEYFLELKLHSEAFYETPHYNNNNKLLSTMFLISSFGGLQIKNSNIHTNWVGNI